MRKPEGEAVTYILGHSERELERLSFQARHFEPFTRSVFQAAGIAAGMRVLDVGSGVGDVAFLAAELVGSSGRVVGTDRVAAAVATARACAAGKGLRNVTFREGDPAELKFDQPFDAIVGRLVLMHSADPAAMLHRLARHLRRGGVLAFLEPAWSFARSVPPVPLYDRCCRWIIGALRTAGAEPEMGLKLHASFVAAGLPAPSMQVYPGIGGPAASLEGLRRVADIVNATQGQIIGSGLATAAEIDGERLADRLQAQAAATDSVIVQPGMVGAWTRV